MFRYFEQLVSPYPDTPPPKLPRGFLAFMWSSARGMRRYIGIMTVLAGVIGAFEAALFSILGHVVDWLAKVKPAGLWEEQRDHLLLLAAVLFASIVLVWLQSLIRHQALAANFPMRLRWNFHRDLLAQSLGFYQDEFAGRLAAKVMQTALAVATTWATLADILVFMVIYFSTLGLVVGQLSSLLLLPLIVWLVLYLRCVCYFIPRLNAVATAQADARALMMGRITDAYSNIATVKLFSHARREASYVRGAMEEFMQSAYGQLRLITGFDVTYQALSVCLLVGMGSTALWLWTEGRVSVGSVAAIVAMALRVNGLAQWIMGELANLFEQVGMVLDGMATLSCTQSVLDKPGARPLLVARGDIRFEDVCFSYGGGGADARPVIDHLNLHIRAGERIGLIGRSGAGKSTVVSLLLRFYDLPQGRIAIDDQDISKVLQDSLRAQIGVVTQDTSLLHRSVRDNVRYGRPEADDAAVLAAAMRAEAHEFISTLRDAEGNAGYDAQVGERGVRLSGGQRQRIAIARVMLKDAPILVLDEATSALDSEVEAAIQQSLNRLMQGKTVVAIAHRLSTIAAMDRLVVIDNGRIVEEGSHASLLAAGGIYTRLWLHQSGGFLGDDSSDSKNGVNHAVVDTGMDKSSVSKSIDSNPGVLT